LLNHYGDGIPVTSTDINDLPVKLVFDCIDQQIDIDILHIFRGLRNIRRNAVPRSENRLHQFNR
ncbi:hypothetical protein BGX30_014349, partial [Mortierella sp. GBA39]